MVVEHKIKDVDDKVCVGCPQNWENVCRAFSTPHSKAEYEYRTSKLPKKYCYPTHRY